jgi:hypothetical protein
VLNGGRMVFEGPLSATKKRENWFRLKTDDFPAAIRELTAKGLIADDRDGRLLSLCDGVGPEQVVRALVAIGMPVYEIAREEATLESFYLGLMKGRPGTPPPVPAAA